jgi:very-short-patch-repair endonuclease
LASTQHGVVTRDQLLALGLSSEGIKHRIRRGRLYPFWRGVYAVGTPHVGQLGLWMAAVLSCGPEAALSHESAAALWDIRPPGAGDVHVSVPLPIDRRRPGIVIHRRAKLRSSDLMERHRIPVTSPALTLVDLATRLAPHQLEAAVSEADKLDRIDPDRLRSALDELTGRPGVAPLRKLLDRRTFILTDSELERRFLQIVRRAGLPLPQTGSYVNGFRVDFYWPGLGLVVETDGLRYHRTPAQQARDRRRDQAHAAAGLTPLRFTHAQVTFERRHVEATLSAVRSRLRIAASR